MLIGDGRIHRGRRRRAVAQPGLERHQDGAGEGTLVDGIDEELRALLRPRQRVDAVLRAGEDVEPRGRAERRIQAAVEARVGERGDAIK